VIQVNMEESVKKCSFYDRENGTINMFYSDNLPKTPNEVKYK